MAITDAKIQVGLPVGATRIRLADGTAPTVRHVPVGEDLLANGGFESNVDGWTTHGSGSAVARTTTAGEYQVGAAAARVTRGSQDESAKLVTRLTVHPGAAYAVEGWARALTATGAKLYVEQHNSGGSFISGSGRTMGKTAGAAFAFVGGIVEPLPNAASLQLYLAVAGGSGDTAAFDGLTVRACAPIVESPYAEPSTPGDLAGGSLAYGVAAAAHHLGDVRVYDMGDETDATLAGSSYARVRGTRHPFRGDVLVDNGVVRLWFVPGYDSGANARGCAFRASAHVEGSWQPYFSVSADVGGNTASRLRSVRLVAATRGLVVVELTDEDGNSARVTVRRGGHAVQVTTTRVRDAGNNWMDFSLGRDERFSFRDASSLLRDDVVHAGIQNVAGSGLTEPYVVDLGPTSPYLVALAFARKPTTLYDNGSGERLLWRLSAAGTNALERAFWVVVLPFPWARGGAFFREAEAATLGGGATSGADGAASGGQVAVLDAQNEHVRHDVVAGRDLPLGEYTLIARARDTNQVANDADLQVYDTTDAALVARAQRTLSSGFSYHTLDFALTSQHDGDTISLYLYKFTTTANTIYADYLLLAPRKRNSATPAHVYFPRDVARDALMATTARESVRRVA